MSEAEDIEVVASGLALNQVRKHKPVLLALSIVSRGTVLLVAARAEATAAAVGLAMARSLCRGGATGSACRDRSYV